MPLPLLLITYAWQPRAVVGLAAIVPEWWLHGFAVRLAWATAAVLVIIALDETTMFEAHIRHRCETGAFNDTPTISLDLSPREPQ